MRSPESTPTKGSHALRIGIYDAWLHTLGGGEKHMLTAAAALSQTHEVHVHSHTAVSRQALERLTSMSLHNLSLCDSPNLPASDLLDLFSEYDLFINATHDSLLPNPCERGVRLLFFPPRKPSAILRALAKALAPAAQISRLPIYSSGFFGPERVGRGWFRNTASHATIRLPATGARSLYFMAGNASATPKTIVASHGKQELERFEVPPTDGGFVPIGPIEVPRADAGTADVDLEIFPLDAGPNNNFSEDRQIGIVIAEPKTGSLRELPVRLLLSRLAPRLGEELERLRGVPPRDAMASYNAIVSNSRFTADWLERWWNLPSKVVYPPVDRIGMNQIDGMKHPEILSVGRFFIGSHHKNHLLMIEAFSMMVGSGLSGWTLRLIGGFGSRPEDRRYLESLRDASSGLPIKIETDVDLPTLHDAYRKASIYWHAAGHGQHERRSPGSFEHFGISPVEAMSAGTVPVVFDGGGLRETVEHGVSGCLWKRKSQLRDLTWRLVRDAVLRRRLSRAAVMRSKEFGADAFNRQFLEIVDALG